MTLHVNDAGTWRQISTVHVNDAGTWRPIQQIHVNDAGTWRLVFSAITVSCADVSGVNAGFGSSGFVVSSAAAPVITNGSGTYTYAWTLQGVSSGAAPSCIATDANTTFSRTVDAGINSISTWTLTVTDTVYGTTAACTITVNLRWVDLS